MNKFKAKTVKIARLKAGPNRYENERIEVEVTVPEGRSAADAVAAIRGFIARQFDEIPDAEQVKAARELLEQFEATPNLK